MRLRLVAFATMLALWPCRAAAQERRSDFQVWSSVSATTSIGHGAELRIDGLLQLADDASRNGRELLRVVLLADLGGRVKLGGGYVWTRIELVAGVHFVEHRAIQEMNFRIPVRGSRLLFVARTQMEGRWREGLRGTSLRLRQLTRLEVPLGAKASAILWNEYFHELRATRWAGPAGPSLMINFVGVRLPVTSALAIEPGYLNQTQFDHGPNRVRHAAALFATFRF